MNNQRLIILTPYAGTKRTLKKTINSTIGQLDKKDIWIIVLDNQNIDNYSDIKKKFKKIVFLNNSGHKGAGNSRNIGLDYLIDNIRSNFLLLPFDGDDRLVNNGVRLIKKKMKNNLLKVVSFAHCKIWPDGTKRVIKYSGIFTLKDLLKNYITPCGSTVIKVENAKILKKFRFSPRYRAEDALFFYLAVKYFRKFKCYPEVLLKYKVGNKNSLSEKKFKMIFYKFMAYKDFGLSNLITIKYFLFYILQGIRRYILKHPI